MKNTELAAVKLPQLARVLDGYCNDRAVNQQISALENQGYLRLTDPAAILVNSSGAADNGSDALYLVSSFFEKGGEPWEYRAKLLSALIHISGGLVRSVRIVDEQTEKKTG